MSYLLDVARNGFKPLNGSEIGSKEAREEYAEQLKLAREAMDKRLAAQSEEANKMNAQFFATKAAIFEFAEKYKHEILDAIKSGTKNAINSFEEEETEALGSLEDRAKERLLNMGYTEAHVELMKSAAKLFDLPRCEKCKTDTK